MIIAPIYSIVAKLGLLNSLTSLIVVYTAFNIPFATFLMQSFFDGIPKDLEDAAMMDGCTRFQALRKVILPLTLPGLAATLGFVFTAAWSELLFALMLVSSNDKMTFPVGLLTFVSKFSVDWGQMMAAGVLALVPSCLFFRVHPAVSGAGPDGRCHQGVRDARKLVRGTNLSPERGRASGRRKADAEAGTD